MIQAFVSCELTRDYVPRPYKHNCFPIEDRPTRKYAFCSCYRDDIRTWLRCANCLLKWT